MPHSSGSFKRIGGFLESQMSVTTYVPTHTTTPLDFQWKRKAGGGGELAGVTNGAERKREVESRQNCEQC
jgi:hypothetical protein